jgi:hypothetical protein
MRWLRYAAAPLVGLLLYWRTPSLWFVNDDFAWLGLPAEARAHGLLYALFTPFAQGTVRVLSERVFFLVFSGLFGLHALPFHLWVLATWILAIVLVQLIGKRLTNSQIAGLVAALVWAANANVAPAVAWASAYNQILCGALILAAFYSRLRGWRVAEWVFYLAGFGALEVMVVYPCLASLHAVCVDRKRLRGAVWLFVPAILFAAFHFWFIPKDTTSVYALVVDGRLGGTIKTYLAWMFEPGSASLRSNIGLYKTPEKIAGLILAAGLIWFTARRLMRREWVVLFFLGWFLFLLAPVLPLPRHLMFYYLTLPSIGLAWLAGWAISSAWEGGLSAKAAAAGLAGIYFIASAAGIEAQTRWYAERGQRMHEVVDGVAAAMAAHPGNAIALEGTDTQLVDSGFADRPFRLVGADRVWLTEDVPSEKLWAQVETGQARVLEVADHATRDVTQSFAQTAVRPGFVDVGNPAYAVRLGPTWYPPENGFRWAPKTASLTIAGPASTEEKLHVTGFAPAPLLASGSATLIFRVEKTEIGRATISKPGEPFEFDFPLPSQTIGEKTIEISIETNRTFHPPGDNRELGMVFGTFAVR